MTKRRDYDKFAISRAIDAVADPDLRRFLEATADVVTGISGNAQVSSLDAVAGLRSVVEQTSGQILSAVNEQGAAVQSLRAEFHQHVQAIGEHVSELRYDLDALSTRDAAQHQEGQRERADLRTRLERIEVETKQFAALLGARPSLEATAALIERADADHARIAAIEAALAARPTPEEARETYEGVRRILDHLGLSDATADG